jgi:hypothetical protein
MGEKIRMKALLHKLFINNWQRKAISLVLAVIIWLMVNHSLTTTRTLTNIPVRVINIPSGKTVDGLQSNGLLTKKITITLVGNQTLLDELTSNDIEVVIDASDKQDEWIASVSKKNLVSLNPEIDISKGISRISHQSFIIRLTKLVTEKIPIVITQPIGQAPRDYQFLDIWPYQLTLTISGPEEVVKHLKAKGVKLTFNLNNITKTQLDALAPSNDSTQGDQVSFFVPDSWKQVSLPLISDTPIEINDPQAKQLRIDFVRCDLNPIDSPIPVSLFFPPEFSNTLNPDNAKITANEFIKKINGLHMITAPLYAKGVDRLFVHIVQNMIEVTVIVMPKGETQEFQWSVQFINPKVLEDRYVSILMSDVSDDEVREMQQGIREEYLRNRFRSYMNRFQFFTSDDKKLELDIQLQGTNIIINEKSSL